MANVIEIIFKATDNVTGSANKVNQSLGGLKKTLAGLGVAFSAVAVARKFITATEAQQKAVAQLEATLKSTGGAAGRTSEQLQAQASALQKVTTYGDEAIISMQSVLGTFTEIKGTNFDAATVSILDLATKMGTDLRSAAIQVGKALNDPKLGISALSKAGIQFTDDQKATIKALVDTGRTAEAQTIILKELERQFGGSARAARNTLGGALDALGNAFGDLFELSKDGTSETVSAINELTELLADPKTIEAAQSLGGALASSLTFAVGVAVELISKVQSLGVGIARLLGGVAADDVEYYTEKIENLRKQIERDRKFLIGPFLEAREKENLDKLFKLEEQRTAAIKVRAIISDLSIPEAAGNKLQEQVQEAVTGGAGGGKNLSPISEDALKKISAAIQAGTSEYDQQRAALEQNIKVLTDYLNQSKGLSDEQLEKIGTTREEYNSVTEAIKNLRFELEQLGAAQAAADVELRQDAARKQAMVSGGPKEKGIAIPFTGDNLTVAINRGLDESMDTIKTTMQEVSESGMERLKELGVVGEQVAAGLQDAFVDFFMNMDKGFKGVLAGFVKLIQRMIAEALAAMAVKAILGAFGFSTAASGGKIFGINKMPAQSRPVPGRASGGMVPVRVGEEGPEMAFLPVGTQIMNARQMAFAAGGGMAGGGGFNYQPVYDIRIQSSGDPRDIEARLSVMLERRLAQHTNEIMTKMRNNGFGRLR